MKKSLLLWIMCWVLGSLFAQHRSFIPTYNDGSKITISRGDTAQVFSVDKKADPADTKSNRYYYYYNHQQIHRNKGSFIGKPLHGSYVKQSREGALIEKGSFKSGLKHGLWERWYANGELLLQAEWRKGQGIGKKSVYTNTGDVQQQFKWDDDQWVLTRKYARLEKRQQQAAEKKRKKEVRKSKRARKKAERQQARQAKKAQKEGTRIWPFGKKKKDGDQLVGEVMPATGLQNEQAKPGKWQLFGKKKQPTQLNEDKKNKKADGGRLNFWPFNKSTKKAKEADDATSAASPARKNKKWTLFKRGDKARAVTMDTKMQ